VIPYRRPAARTFLSGFFLGRRSWFSVQIVPGANLKSSPYLNTTQASRAVPVTIWPSG
jgi:hypothetical protein